MPIAASASSGAVTTSDDRGEHEIDAALGRQLPRGERGVLDVEERLVRKRRRAQPADVDAVQPAAQLHVRAGVEELLHRPVELRAAEIARADDGAGDAELGEHVAGVRDVAEPVVGQAVVCGVALVAHDAGRSVPELGVLVEQRRDLGGFVAGADEQDRPQEVTGAPARVEPGAVAAARRARPARTRATVPITTSRRGVDPATAATASASSAAPRQPRARRSYSSTRTVQHARSVEADRVEDRDAPDDQRDDRGGRHERRRSARRHHDGRGRPRHRSAQRHRDRSADNEGSATHVATLQAQRASHDANCAQQQQK